MTSSSSSSVIRVIVWLVLALAALIWALSASGFSLVWTVTLIVMKSCGSAVKGVFYVLKGGW